MHTTNRLVLISAVLVLATGAISPARADVTRTFLASGTFDDGSTLDGTLTIDVTTGDVTAADLMRYPTHGRVEQFSTVQDVLSQSPSADGTTIQLSVGYTPLYLDLIVFAPSLVGYQGGELASETDPLSYLVVDGSNSYVDDAVSAYYSEGSVNLLQGSLIAPVPEPSTLVLSVIGAGICALHGWARHRRD
jgi:hypothetical protein